MILLLAAALMVSQPATKSFDATAFTVPPGFEYWENPDHVNFRRIDPTNWLLFGVYQSRPAAGAAATEFAADWNDLLRASGVAAPMATPRRVGADCDALAGSAMTPEGFVELIDVRAGGRIISVIVESGSADGFKTYHRTIEEVLASIAIKRGSTVTAPVSSAPKPEPAEASGLIHASDLVGVWNCGSTPSTTYALLASGEYVGATSHFFATEYTLQPDGTFTSRYAATNPPIKFKSAGTWGIEAGLIVLREPKGLKRYQIVKFGPQPDGRVELSLVTAGGVINEYTHTDDWYRAGDRDRTR
jgi:hypothetical protein